MSTPANKGPLSGWRDLGRFLGEYWKTYGGTVALLKSPYFQLSIGITAATWPLWTAPDWWDIMLAMIPSILGFTIGGFAIVLALGAGDFGAALSSARKADAPVLDSALAKLGAAFCHFIVIQFSAIVIALIAKACSKAPPPIVLDFLAHTVFRQCVWCVAWFVSIYSLTLAVSTAHWIFSNIKLLVRFQKLDAARKKALRDQERRKSAEGGDAGTGH